MLEGELCSRGSVTCCLCDRMCVVTFSLSLFYKRENACGAPACWYKMIHQITVVLFEPLICNASVASDTLLPLTLFLNYYWTSHMVYLVSVSYVQLSKKTPLTTEEKVHVHDCTFLTETIDRVNSINSPSLLWGCLIKMQWCGINLKAWIVSLKTDCLNDKAIGCDDL